LTWLGSMLGTSPLVGSSDEATAAIVSLSVILCYAAPLVLKYVMDLKLRPDSNLHILYYVAATVVTFVFVNAAQPDFIYFRF